MRSVLAAMLAVAAGSAAVAVPGCRGDKDPTARVDPNEQAKEQAKFDGERAPDAIIAALDLHPGARVADVGAGTGLMTVHLAQAVGPTGHVVATDVNADVLALMKQRLAAAGVSGDVVERRVVRADEPGLERGVYDAILLAEVDNYFADPVAWLTAAIPALKPGGRIVIENRVHRRAKSMAAAEKAGLVLVSESNPIPANFIAAFSVGGKT
jgi:ubiquinone/menaquinone biosynthesis C-methylase UbiE